MPTCSWQILMAKVWTLDISRQRPGSYWYWINFKKWLEQHRTTKKMIDTYKNYHYLSRNWRFYLIGVTTLFSKHPTTQIPNELCKKHQAQRLGTRLWLSVRLSTRWQMQISWFFATRIIPFRWWLHQAGTVRSQVSSHVDDWTMKDTRLNVDTSVMETKHVF